MKHKVLLILSSLMISLAFLLQGCMQEDFNEAMKGSKLSTLNGDNVSMTKIVLSDKEMLGKKIFFDNNSSPNNMSCATCHDPDYGFTGPNSYVNLTSGIYSGAVKSRFGNRKPPSAAYATFSPIFHFEDAEDLFVGGNFWDGRATGWTLGEPAAEQAIGPFLNPVEHNHSAPIDVLKQIEKSGYYKLWLKVWGAPIQYSTDSEITENYNKVGYSIAAYEGSDEVNAFTSKYDYYLKGQVTLSEEELRGLELFNSKGMCNLCHPSDGPKPLFTDFTFDNLGTPKNPNNPFYETPGGSSFIDPGLGGFLATLPQWQDKAQDNWGKHKVPTLRNVDKRPSENNVKAYMHNGVFKSLKEVVHFYNTRDVETWPAPEISQNINVDELGNLGLTETEEDAIVAFMKTLSDGYVVKTSNKK